MVIFRYQVRLFQRLSSVVILRLMDLEDVLDGRLLLMEPSLIILVIPLRLLLVVYPTLLIYGWDLVLLSLVLSLLYLTTFLMEGKFVFT